ncbi:MAG: LPS biosynthesis protein WbpP [Planctomycetaceae bacterium]|nr:LPS biosynthesis protein WbpP [Planctomycetaceae bacterium]
MNCLVTGGAGFIGSHVATALVRRGDRVRVLDNLCTGYRANLAHVAGDVEFIEGDVLDDALVEKSLDGVEVVFHQAALASVPRSMERPLDTHEACATATLKLLIAAQRAGVRRVVYAGSSSCYGDQPFASKREIDLLSPLSPYAAAKLAGEMYCQAFAASLGVETVTLRYFNVFGPRQDPDGAYAAVIPKFISRMLAGGRPTIFGAGLQSRDFTYVDNVVEGNLRAAAAEGVSGRVFNLACGQQFNLLQLVAALNEILGTDLQPEFAPPRAGDVQESLADVTAARALLGYEQQIGFDEGLRRTVDYFRQAQSAEVSACDA